ncbi:hypothetical protein RN001_002787 [Aquatica leii]|uniref:Uncharacterized protein n=1 Tax=Aquatica leii TaxID=1421715 RepID=A0AAN7SDI4_9COLE|nr:hypothetical protein RN001_002787 [Aquatica leii]
MDDKNNKKTSSTPSFTASASNRNKNVNKMHVKVIKHYQPMMQTRPDSAVAELPDFGISDDDYNTKNSHGINSTDMRTTGLKCTIRAITKPNSNIQHDSAVNLLTNTKESKTKQTKRISLQCNYKQTGKKVAICSKVTKNLKNSATTPKPNKNVKTDSQSYVNELKDEINEFKSSQTSLTKAADNLKAEIKEFRDSLTNIHMSSAKISDLKDSNYDTKAIQTSYNDLMRAYGHLLDENKEKLQSSEIDEISWSYNNLPFPSLIVPSTSICNKDSIFNSIPNWMFDKKDKNLNFNKSIVLKDISIISAGKESLPESLSYSNEDFLFANDSIRTIDNIRESNLPQDINSSKLSYSKILQPKYVKFDCSKVQINEDDFNKGKLENDSPNSYRSERKVNKHIIDSRTGENEKEANHESDHSELKLPVVLQSIPSLNIEGYVFFYYT